MGRLLRHLSRMIQRLLFAAALVAGSSASDASSQDVPTNAVTDRQLGEKGDFGGATPINPTSWLKDFVGPEIQYLPAVVDVEFVITAAGRVERCVVKKAEYASIGEEACTALVKGARFKPATGGPRRAAKATHGRMRLRIERPTE